MLSLVILATTLWVCPGDVFVNEPKPGCKPFHESNKEGFSTVPEPKEGPSQGTSQGSREVIIVPERGAVGRGGYASEETCERYAEWLRLYTKIGGLNANEYDTDEFERWQKIRYNFSSLNPPNCP
jgi:hypothetical protein